MKTKVLALTLLASCAAAVSAPLVKQTATVAIPRDFTAQPLPRFGNGFVLAYDFHMAQVWEYDHTGKTLFALSLSTPDATDIHITDMAAAADGTVAVSASGTLQPVELSTTTPVTKPTVLLGGDGDKLVFYSKPPASVSWFAVQ